MNVLVTYTYETIDNFKSFLKLSNLSKTSCIGTMNQNKTEICDCNNYLYTFNMSLPLFLISNTLINSIAQYIYA